MREQRALSRSPWLHAPTSDAARALFLQLLDTHSHGRRKPASERVEIVQVRLVPRCRATWEVLYR